MALYCCESTAGLNATGVGSGALGTAANILATINGSVGSAPPNHFNCASENTVCVTVVGIGGVEKKLEIDDAIGPRSGTPENKEAKLKPLEVATGVEF